MAVQVEPIRGVIAPTLTPFNDDLTLALDLYVEQSRHLLATGCAGLAPFGTTGELSVGIDERIGALDRLIDRGVDPKKLIPGTGLTNLIDTARLTKHAVDRGCAGAMVLPPFYIKDVHDDGLFAYYARLIELVGADNLRIYLYHIPQVSHVGLSIELVQRLHSAFPAQIVGIKDSSGDWANTRRLLTEVPGLIVYPGSELPLPEAVALGAAGCITATANTNATQIAKVFDLLKTGREAEAKQAHEPVKKFRLKIQEFGQIPAQKYLLAEWKHEPRWRNVRPPVIALSESAGRRLLAELEALGFTASRLAQV